MPDGRPERRLRNLLTGLVPVVVLMIGLNAGLGLAFGLVPAWLARESLVSFDALAQIAARVAAVEKQQDTTTAAGNRLAVIVGLSSAREGLSPSLLARATGDQFRVLNLATSGGSFSELAAYCRPLIRSQLRPDAIVVGLHPSWLSGRSVATQLPGPARQVWVLVNRSAINNVVQIGLYWLRSQMEALRDAPASQRLHGQGADPWIVQNIYSDDHAPTDFLDLQLREWAAMGWFDASRLTENSDEADSLRRLLRSLGRITPRLIVVMMPESEAFRSRVPVSAAAAIVQIVKDQPTNVTVMDLRASMPSYAFRDHAHLNSYGRQLLSELFGRSVLMTPGRDPPQ